MGNSASSGRTHDETVDYGALVPQGVYTGPRDWAHQVVAQAIVDRRLAPFYRPLEDYEDEWTDEQILAARKDPPAPPEAEDAEASAPAPAHVRPHPSSIRSHGKKASTAGKGKEQATLNEASLYRGAVECPICFLYYPSNINYSRCCAQALCTECFVQIKRAEPDAQHLESEPAACPYCVRSDFGVVYKPPAWRAGIGSEGHSPPSPGVANMPKAPSPDERKRRQSFSANDPQVVTTDQVRPDWEAKLEAVKAAVARRAARRIIMRQVGDRLIPVGISSGRVQVIDEGSAAAAQDGEGSRRQRRRDREIGRMLGLPGFNSANYPGGVIGTQDLEELMIAEAMRQSVLEEEERQRKEQDKTAKGGAPAPASDASSSASTSGPAPGSSAPQSALHLPAITGASLLPPTADDRGRPGHRPSSSISSLQPDSGGATPPGSLRARSQPPFSALSAALRGAASAASAIGAPGKRREGHASGSGASTPGVSPQPPPAPAPVPLPTPPMDAGAGEPARVATPHLPTPPRSAPPVEEPVQIYLPQPSTSEADESDLAALASIPASAFTASSSSALAPRPIPTHADSFASTITVDSEATIEPYDVLSSSPESDAGTTSLLRGEAPPAAPDLSEAQTPGLMEGKPLGEA